jgi:hypothetical protein
LRGTHAQAKPRGGDGGHRRGLGLWPMGLAGPAAGLERIGSGLWARPILGGFVFFRNNFPAQKQIRKFQKMLTMHEKYSENHKNSRKIPRDSLGHEQSK